MQASFESLKHVPEFIFEWLNGFIFSACLDHKLRLYVNGTSDAVITDLWPQDYVSHVNVNEEMFVYSCTYIYDVYDT